MQRQLILIRQETNDNDENSARFFAAGRLREVTRPFTFRERLLLAALAIIWFAICLWLQELFTDHYDEVPDGGDLWITVPI